MNMETVYSILMNSGWFFLLGWTLLLLSASVIVFWDKSPKQSLRLVHSRTSAPYSSSTGGMRKVSNVRNVAVRG
jgi:hypothetical protein